MLQASSPSLETAGCTHPRGSLHLAFETSKQEAVDWLLCTAHFMPGRCGDLLCWLRGHAQSHGNSTSRTKPHYLPASRDSIREAAQPAASVLNVHSPANASSIVLLV